MKKLLAIFFASILSLPAYSETNTNLNTSTPNISIADKNYSLESFTGQYNLLSYKINISLKSDNKVFVNLQSLPLSKQFIKIIPLFFYNQTYIYSPKEEFKKRPNLLDPIIFPYNKEYELVPIGGLTFILKNSGGFSIEFKNIDDQNNKTLVLRNPNGSILNKEEFDSIILKKEYEELFINNDINYDDSDRADKKSELLKLKDNMHRLQIFLETYAIDWSGFYPDKLETLVNEAVKKQYWKEFLNPYTQKVGMGKNGAVISFKEYKNYTPHPSLKGLVIFENTNCSYDKVEKKNQCSSYKIYGTDENGNLIQDKGKVFFLTNE